ncbi:MAG: VWA domain-containing protein [Caldilineaceae bacterium]|nr:VWA domain-containing protein [Caldilineaceae bacterium]
MKDLFFGRRMRNAPAPFYRLLALLGVILALLIPRPLSAAPVGQATQPAVTRDSADQALDVVVLLDDSGSMATCWPWPQDGPPFNPPCGGASPNLPSDPAGLRYSAARLLLELADADDRVAVVRFDSAAQGVGALGELTPVGSDENRRALSATLQAPDDYFQRGYTRIDLGLDEAIRLLDAGRTPGRSQYVLLLTDGEPSAQSGVINQTARVREQIAALNAAGVLIFPVVLCNPTAGCAGDFLREEFADFGVREANSAPELLQLFSAIVADMKPDRSVIGAAGSGALQLSIRAAHGAQSLTLITPSSALLNLQRDEQPMLARTLTDDANITVSAVEQAQLTAGRWQADTGDQGGFAVVQAASYPQLLNPPPSIADSPASVRYYPAGKPPLLMARGAGPGAAEPITYNDGSVLQPFGDDGVRALALNEEPGAVRLQLGDDAEPLQLVRTFQLEARADLPLVRAISPTVAAPGLLEDGRQQLQAGFQGDDAISDVAGTVFVSDATDDARNGALVYQAIMQCANRLCRDDGFTPEDGRAYRYTFVLEAVKEGLRFSDWAQSETQLAPAVYLRGLPGELDLARMPADGWPIELASGATEEIGSIQATVTLARADDDDPAVTTPVEGVSVQFNEDVPETGSLATSLRIDGLDDLRPGAYTGTLTLQTFTPSGLPMNVEIRPGAALPVTLDVARPAVVINAEALDFGETLFDTSPNFRLNQEALLPVAFSGDPFALHVEMADNSCPDIIITPDELRRQAGQDVLPLRLSSSQPVPAGTCSGRIALSGPNGDYDVTPTEISWRTRVSAVEWAAVDPTLRLGNLQRPGEEADAILRLRFTGKTPFIVEMADLQAAGSGEQGIAVSDEDVAMSAVEVTGAPDENGLYAVPLTFTARRAIPFDPLRGSVYAGTLGLRVAGLEQVQPVDLTFRSPNAVQRYLAPVFVPVYTLPWALLTVPLTLLLLLLLTARLRGRDFDEDAVEEAAMAATRQMAAAEFAAQAASPASDRAAAGSFTPVSAPAQDAVWGRSEWGAPWAGEPADEASAPPATDRAPGDPWSQGW